MRWKAAVWAALVPLFAGAAWAPADDEFDALKKDYEQQMKFWDQARDATDPATQPADPSAAFAPRFKAYAEKHAGRPAAIPALLMVIQIAWPDFPPSDKPSDAKWAMQQLAEKHAAQPEIKAALPQLRRWAYWSVGMETLTPLYERVRKDNPDKDAQAGAMFNLAIGLYEMASAQVPPEMGGAKSDAQREGERKRAEELFRAVVKDYAGSDVAASAARYVFELDHLQIGMKAPEIVGTSADEKEIKLSDFRGRVVVIDFWGFW